MKKKLFALSVVLILALALTACGAKGTMGVEPNEETGGVDVTFEKAGDGTASLAYITIGEGECLVVSPNLEKGAAQIVVTRMEREATQNDLGTADEPSLDETVQGKAMTTYDLEPGEYALGITARENPTGTMMILPYSAEEIRAQDEALAEELAKLGITLPEDAAS